jgi:cell division protease FtsH
MNKKQIQWNIAYLIAAMLAVMLFQSWWGRRGWFRSCPTASWKPHSLMDVERVVISDRHIMGYLSPTQHGKRILTANRVEPEVAERLSRFGVPFTREYESGFFSSSFRGWRPR